MGQKWGFALQPSWTEKELELLGESLLFRGAPGKIIRDALQAPGCTRERVEKGTEIYSPKRFRRSLGILLKGTAQVSKGALVVSVLGPGELFGAAALFHRRDRFETTITAKEACTIAFFPEALMLELLGRDAAVCGNYLRYLSERIHFLNQKLDALTAAGTVQKLARYLLSESRKGGTVTCPAVELARRLDVGRSSLYRAFEVLEERGIIQRSGKAVEVLDVAGLEAFGGD